MNTQDIVWILTNNYSYIKLNLKELKAFDKAHNDCFLTRTHNKMKQEFDGSHLSLVDFTVYRPDIEAPQNILYVFNKIKLELLPNKIYKLLGESGSGKTTFLKSITNNWQYTEGIVKLPENAKDNICFIPQHSFIPRGTLLEILTYCLNPKKFLLTSLQISHEQNLRKQINISPNDHDEKNTKEMKVPLLNHSNHRLYNNKKVTVEESIPELIEKVTTLLMEVGLLPDVIKPGELEVEGINWRERLSGGEKQKIGIIQALLGKPKFIIMDESTSALDIENKQVIYKIIKRYLMSLAENYIVIYTDHDNRENFADAYLTITGQSLDLSVVED
jgi:ABC-type uncharacterized transport system fused permease/ATPase subunit